MCEGGIGTTDPLPLQYLPAVAVILRATTKQGKRWVNCQDMSQSAQGGDKSHQTCQTLQSVLKHMSFVQGPVEESCSGQERGVKEDKLDCYCVNCGVYIHTALSTVRLKTIAMFEGFGLSAMQCLI